MFNMFFRFQIHALAILGGLIFSIIFFYPQLTMAAVFVPDDNELSRFTLEEKAIQRKSINALIKNLPQGESHVRLDDMLFRVDSLRQKAAFSSNKWTDGIVYYTFDSEVTDQNRNRFLDAAAEWSAVSDVTFVERTNGEPNYVYVQNGTRNASAVGMAGGRQTLTMYHWAAHYVILHEIGHALGLYHEQSRTDRNDFVTILTDNILPGYQPNFNISLNAVGYGAYDFKSIMHYKRNTFSVNVYHLNTIEPLPAYSHFLYDMGDSDHLSEGDKAAIAGRYGATTDGDPNDSGPNDSGPGDDDSDESLLNIMPPILLLLD